MDLKIKTETEEFHVRTCGIIKQENNFQKIYLSTRESD